MPCIVQILAVHADINFALQKWIVFIYLSIMIILLVRYAYILGRGQHCDPRSHGWRWPAGLHRWSPLTAIHSWWHSQFHYFSAHHELPMQNKVRLMLATTAMFKFMHCAIVITSNTTAGLICSVRQLDKIYPLYDDSNSAKSTIKF